MALIPTTPLIDFSLYHPSKALKTRSIFLIIVALVVGLSFHFFLSTSKLESVGSSIVESHKNVTRTSSVVESSKTVARRSLLIPDEPDPTPTLKIQKAVGTPSNGSTTTTLSILNEECNPTSQIRLYMSNSSKWTMKALDSNGIPKSVGGDEFYVTYDHDLYELYDTTVPEKTKEHPLAVARIHDLGNGLYDLDFVLSPMAKLENVHPGLLNHGSSSSEVPRTSGGNLTVHFTYTCGIGKIPPPFKSDWENGGYTQTSYTKRILGTVPPIQLFQIPKLVVDLDQFHHIALVGDSLMDQFHGAHGVPFHSGMTFSGNVRAPLNSSTLTRFTSQINEVLAKATNVVQKGLLRRNKTATQDADIKLVLIVGSSTWDILEDSPDQGETFDDHRDAMRRLIEYTQSNHPRVTLIWKSPTMVHNHVVISHTTRWFGPPQKASKRIKYMSASRAADLYNYQKDICDSMGILFLDVYNATALSGDWHFPTDGRHYRPELNHMVFNWFVSRPQNVTIKYAYTGYG